MPKALFSLRKGETARTSSQLSFGRKQYEMLPSCGRLETIQSGNAPPARSLPILLCFCEWILRRPGQFCIPSKNDSVPGDSISNKRQTPISLPVLHQKYKPAKIDYK